MVLAVRCQRDRHELCSGVLNQAAFCRTPSVKSRPRHGRSSRAGSSALHDRTGRLRRPELVVRRPLGAPAESWTIRAANRTTSQGGVSVCPGVGRLMGRWPQQETPPFVMRSTNTIVRHRSRFRRIRVRYVRLIPIQQAWTEIAAAIIRFRIALRRGIPLG
jgi:hypothetical protein